MYEGFRRSPRRTRLRFVACVPILPIVGLILGPMAAALAAQAPAAAAVLGFEPGTAGGVIDATQVARYCRLVDRRSDRVASRIFGLSTAGSPLWLVMVSSPENLARWRDARRLEDKTFALITCGIHPDEVDSTGTFFRLVERLATAPSAAHRELLDRVIVLLVPCVNPDGTDRVAAWLRRAGKDARAVPFLYHRYSGHDLNRDWLFATQAETRAVIRRIHHVFFPWVTIDLHQMGRLGARVFVPPYADPVDPAVSPDLRFYVDLLGQRVFDGLARDGRRGVVQRWVYDAWTPARAYPFYHGGLRFLIEVASGRYAYPEAVRESDLWVFGTANEATTLHPNPWRGGEWGPREATEAFLDATETTLLALLEEPLLSGQRAHFRRVEREHQGVVLDPRGEDPGVVRALLSGLSVTGSQLEPGPDSGTWIVRDPPWGQGWSRSLLLCTPYPKRNPRERLGRTSFNDRPYDTSTHDLSHLAGLKAERLERDGQAPAPEPAGRGLETRVSAWLDAAARAGAVPTTGAGERVRLPGNQRGRPWLVTGRSLMTVASLADLLEAGVTVARLTARVRLDHRTAEAGDLVLSGVHIAWVERLVEDGAHACELDPSSLEDLRRSGGLVQLRYPRMWVLEGLRPAPDEGWLRWVLEEYQFRFRRIRSDDLLVDREFAGAARWSGWGRDVLIVPEGTIQRPQGRWKLALEEFVERGGRVIALGRAARWIRRTCELPALEVRLDDGALPGTVLKTAVSAARGYRDPALWGYARPPGVFYHGGPLWRVPPAQPPALLSSEPLLEVARSSSVLCGVLGADDVAAAGIRGAAVLVRLRHRGSGGEWFLCGFRPHYRGWTLGTLRVLFNMILAP